MNAVPYRMNTGETTKATNDQRAAGSGRSRRASPQNAAVPISMNPSEISRPIATCSPSTLYTQAAR